MNHRPIIMILCAIVAVNLSALAEPTTDANKMGSAVAQLDAA